VSVSQDDIEGVDLAPGEGDQGLVTSFAVTSFAVVEGLRGRGTLDEFSPPVALRE
jgi:hypothetical protein